MAKEIELKIKLDTAESANSLKDIKKSLKELKNAALEAGEGSEAFNKLTAAAGQLQDKLGDVNGTIKALAGNTAENLTKSFNSVSNAGIGAFGAISGAQALLGDESQHLAAAMDKVKTAMVMTQSIKDFANIGQSLKDFKTVLAAVIPQLFTKVAATTAQTAATVGQTVATGAATTAQISLNVAMLANPIFLVVAALVALVAGLAIFAMSGESAAEEQERLNKAHDEHVIAINKNIEAIKNLRSANDAGLALDIELAKTKGESIEEIRRLEIKANLDKRNDLAISIGKERDWTTAELKEKEALLNELTLINAKYLKNVDDNKTKNNADAEVKEKAHQKELFKLKEERAKLEKGLADKAIAERDANDKAEEASTKSLIEKVKALKEDEELRLAGSDQAKLDIKKARDIADIEAEYAKTNLGTEAQQAKADAFLAIDSAYMESVNTLRLSDADKAQVLKDKELAAAKELAAKKLTLEKQVADSILNLNDIVFSIQSIRFKKGSAEAEAAAKKHFQVNKAVQLGLAINDGYKAITASLSLSPIAIGPVPNPAGIASLAFAAITAAANVAKIAASKYGGGGGSVSAPSAPSVSGPRDAAPASSSLFSGPPSLQKIGGNQGGGPQKVYVVSSDLTGAQNADSVLERRARFTP